MKPLLEVSPTIALLLVLQAILAPQAAICADWPQWGGPQRNFHVPGVKLADSWPKDGLRQIWKRPLGDGYSGIVVAKGRLVTMFRSGASEVVVALDGESGKTMWQHAYPAPFLEGTNVEEFGPGPLATPLIVDGRLCTVGVTGILHCLELGGGRVLWKHKLIEDLRGTNLYRGYSASPIAYGDKVILPVGGPGHAVVAFRLEDGSIAWRQQDFAISHVSPLLIRSGNQDQLVVLGEKMMVGLEPRSGELLWRHSHPIQGGYVSSTPVWGEDGRLFFSGAYGEGSRCLQLTRDGNKTTVEQVWHNNRMRVHHSNVIRVGDYVYGASGDFAAIAFTALHVKTGKLAWQDRRVGRASCLYADGKFIALQEDGQLVLAKMSPDGLAIMSSVKPLEGRSWTAPALVGNQIFVRNREVVMALELPK